MCERAHMHAQAFEPPVHACGGWKRVWIPWELWVIDLETEPESSGRAGNIPNSKTSLTLF